MTSSRHLNCEIFCSAPSRPSLRPLPVKNPEGHTPARTSQRSVQLTASPYIPSWPFSKAWRRKMDEAHTHFPTRCEWARRRNSISWCYRHHIRREWVQGSSSVQACILVLCHQLLYYRTLLMMRECRYYKCSSWIELGFIDPLRVHQTCDQSPAKAKHEAQLASQSCSYQFTRNLHRAQLDIMMHLTACRWRPSLPWCKREHGYHFHKIYCCFGLGCSSEIEV